jgi:3-methyladenine DNA glycosylase AlkD
MLVDEIRKKLYEEQDLKYRELQARTIPGVGIDNIIGVRTPILRKYAKELKSREDIGSFLDDLPHKYFDEDQLHAFILSEMKDYDKCLAEVKRFIPYVNNWATCDQMSPKVFKKHKEELLETIKEWISSDEVYTIRFGVGMLMEHFLDEDFKPKYLTMVSKLRSDEYYVNMMIAWYFATALAKQYDAAIPFIEKKRLAVWTHNKAIQKSIESYRITAEQKDYLRSLKIKG